jgi:hypothetical protein
MVFEFYSRHSHRRCRDRDSEGVITVVAHESDGVLGIFAAFFAVATLP